jgi:hypothetical protein
MKCTEITKIIENIHALEKELVSTITSLSARDSVDLARKIFVEMDKTESVRSKAWEKISGEALFSEALKSRYPIYKAIFFPNGEDILLPMENYQLVLVNTLTGKISKVIDLVPSDTLDSTAREEYIIDELIGISPDSKTLYLKYDFITSCSPGLFAFDLETEKRIYDHYCTKTNFILLKNGKFLYCGDEEDGYEAGVISIVGEKMESHRFGSWPVHGSMAVSQLSDDEKYLFGLGNNGLVDAYSIDSRSEISDIREQGIYAAELAVVGRENSAYYTYAGDLYFKEFGVNLDNLSEPELLAERVSGPIAVDKDSQRVYIFDSQDRMLMVYDNDSGEIVQEIKIENKKEIAEILPGKDRVAIRYEKGGLEIYGTPATLRKKFRI